MGRLTPAGTSTWLRTVLIVFSVLDCLLPSFDRARQGVFTKRVVYKFSVTSRCTAVLPTTAAFPDSPSARWEMLMLFSKPMMVSLTLASGSLMVQLGVRSHPLAPLVQEVMNSGPSIA